MDRNSPCYYATTRILIICCLALGVVADPPRVPPPPCSLNGMKRSDGTCKCEKGWVGHNCGQLDLIPAAPLDKQVTSAAATTTNNSVAWQTWGMSVVGPINGVYHGYTTEIVNSCKLGLYGVASTVIHMEAEHPTGPWKKKGVALPVFAHNPQAIILPNGSIALYHIGTPLPSWCVGNCTGNSTHGLNPGRNTSCQTAWGVSHASSVALAENPSGPFRRFPYIFGTRGPTNPAPLLLKNGTLLVAARRASGPVIPMYSTHWSKPEGPYEQVKTVTHTTNVSDFRRVSEQDPYFFTDANGNFHLLWQRSWPHFRINGRCGGGHDYSVDGINFFFGEPIYVNGDFTLDQMRRGQCNLTWDNQTRGNLTSRQRPTLFDDNTTGRRYIFNGASVFVDMYVHSFTMVQEVNMNDAIV